MREDKKPQYCYQVQDFTMPLPRQLEDLHASCGAEHPRGALVLVIHVLMSEVGFTLQKGINFEEQVKEHFNWSDDNSLLKIQYVHSSCPNIEFCVAFMHLEPNLVVHGLVKAENQSNGYFLNLRISDFIQKVFLSDPEPNKVYKNLPSLSRTVKDSIALPLLGWAQSVANVSPTFGFMTLSSEIQLLILGFLNAKELLMASLVNANLYDLASNPVLWKRLFLKTFPNADFPKADDAVDWKELYKREHLLRKEQQRENNLNTIRILPRLPPPEIIQGMPGRINPGPFLPHPFPLFLEDDPENLPNPLHPPRVIPSRIPEILRRPPGPTLPRFGLGQFPPSLRFGNGFGFG